MEVRCVRLAPMRVACAHAISATPEADAWSMLLGWARKRGLLDEFEFPRLFGYGEPSGENGSHRYDTWLTVGPAVGDRPGEAVQIREFLGGLYAVTRCSVADIGDAWMGLQQWVLHSPYRPGQHQWLEEHLTLPRAPWHDILLDLYHPLSDDHRASA